MTAPGDPNRPSSENNGGTLSERVRSLRLADKAGEAAPLRINKLPWAFCVGLLVVTALFGYRAYRVGPALPSEEGTEERVGAKGERPPAPTGGGQAPGEVVLQAKGYVTLVNPVQVSPIVGGRLFWV